MTSENPSGQQKPGRMTEMTPMAQLLTSLRCRLQLAPSRQPHTWLKAGPRCSHCTKATVKWDWWPQLDTWLHLTSKPCNTPPPSQHPSGVFGACGLETALSLQTFPEIFASHPFRWKWKCKLRKNGINNTNWGLWEKMLVLESDYSTWICHAIRSLSGFSCLLTNACISLLPHIVLFPYLIRA